MIWKDVEGYEGIYKISDTGILINQFGKVLKPGDNGRGYASIYLWKNRKKKRHYIHRLVAEAFIPNPEQKPYINHIDNNPRNNHVKNLEWCTPKENTDWMIVQGRFKRTETWLKNLDIGLQPRRKRVKRINPSTGEVVIYDGINKTKKDGFTTSSVSQCCNGTRHSHHGYVWEFV